MKEKEEQFHSGVKHNVFVKGNVLHIYHEFRGLSEKKYNRMRVSVNVGTDENFVIDSFFNKFMFVRGSIDISSISGNKKSEIDLVLEIDNQKRYVPLGVYLFEKNLIVSVVSNRRVDSSYKYMHLTTKVKSHEYLSAVNNNGEKQVYAFTASRNKLINIKTESIDSFENPKNFTLNIVYSNEKFISSKQKQFIANEKLKSIKLLEDEILYTYDNLITAKKVCICFSEIEIDGNVSNIYNKIRNLNIDDLGILTFFHFQEIYNSIDYSINISKIIDAVKNSLALNDKDLIFYEDDDSLSTINIFKKFYSNSFYIFDYSTVKHYDKLNFKLQFPRCVKSSFITISNENNEFKEYENICCFNIKDGLSMNQVLPLTKVFFLSIMKYGSIPDVGLLIQKFGNGNYKTLPKSK